MTRIDAGEIEFSINRTPYKLLHMPASAVSDGNGKVVSESPARWIMKIYGGATFEVSESSVIKILAHIRNVEAIEAKRVSAVSELASVTLTVTEEARYASSEEARKLRQEKSSFINDVIRAPKDKDKLASLGDYIEGEYE